MRTHAKVAKKRREPKKYKLDGNPIVITVHDGRFRVSVGLPTACLKIDPQRVRRNLAENFISRKFACDKYHDESERKIQ